MRAVRALGVAAGGALLADAAPSVAAIRWLRVAALPRLSGLGASRHVALTVDDGPDPTTTPAFLAVFAEQQVRATFFVLGARLRRSPDLAGQITAAGHEIGVHGWTHRPHLLRSPTEVTRDITRAHRCVTELTGRSPAYWRPPHGIPTATGLATARYLGMRAVLWSADGRDWRDGATPAGVTRKLTAQLTGGAVVLLHDSAGRRGDSRAALEAVPDVVAWCRARGWVVGPLGEHGLPGDPP